jgi:hypothetical protein
MITLLRGFFFTFVPQIRLPVVLVLFFCEKLRKIDRLGTDDLLSRIGFIANPDSTVSLYASDQVHGSAYGVITPINRNLGVW